MILKLKRLIPNLAVFGAVTGVYNLAAIALKGNREKYKEFLTNLNIILDTIPNNTDTVFSSAKKAGTLCLHTIFGEYKYLGEFLDKFQKSNPDFKSISDYVFINSFFDEVVSHNIPTRKEFYASIGTSKEDMMSIYCYEFSNNRKLMAIESKGYFGNYNLSTFFVNFPYQELIKDILDTYNGNVYVCYDAKNNKILFNKLKHETIDEDKVYNSELTDAIVSDLKRFMALNLQRSYLFIGAPGTGKSTTCYQIAKRIANNCMKIDSSLLKVFSDDMAETLVNFANTKVIVFDDIDRLTGDQIAFNKLLYCIESIKTFKLKPILLATANNVGNIDLALFRPGRFDRIIKFDLPNEQERSFFFKEEMKGIPGIEIKILTNATDKLSQAHLKEICNQYKAGVAFKDILKDITVRKSFLFKEEPAAATTANSPKV